MLNIILSPEHAMQIQIFIQKQNGRVRSLMEHFPSKITI